MALTDESGVNATMLVSPTGGIGMNGGFGNGFNGDWGWIILLLLILVVAGVMVLVASVVMLVAIFTRG